MESGLRRVLFIVLGMLSLCLAYLGWLLPGLPCSPFVTPDSFFFSKSSPRLERWLLRNRLFGQHLRDLRTHRGIRLHLKIKATLMVIVVVTCSVTLLIWTHQPWYLWGIIPPLALFGLGVMWLGVRTLGNGVE